MTTLSRTTWSSRILSSQRLWAPRRLCPPPPPSPPHARQPPRRCFHEYFVTHLPSCSLRPDSDPPPPPGPDHKPPRDASTAPCSPQPGLLLPAPTSAPTPTPARDLTVVRIPLRRAKHHFGVATARGTRPYNEDTDQAGTLDMPAFAARQPKSHVIKQKPGEAVVPVEGIYGDPQIFYFAVFDGHGGGECSEFLRDELHAYIEEASSLFGLQTSLRRDTPSTATATATTPLESPEVPPERASDDQTVADETQARSLKRGLVAEYKHTVGGYFRRFSPEYFDLADEGGHGGRGGATGLESVLMYAFLRADLDFVTAHAQKPDPHDAKLGDLAVNHDEVLGAPHTTTCPSGHRIGGRTRFQGGSTASVALISTPTPAPFWHPAAAATVVVAHVGDSRVLLCDTATGRAAPLTSDHHPSTPVETRRLMRWAPRGSTSSDSFGEERITGLANSRAFGDLRSKRVGVSAEPDITRVDMAPAEHSFMVLMSDGVSGSVSDQEIVDIVKEARTPEQAARSVVQYATEVTKDGDNATCLVVRLGGWERRSEGGLGSLGTKEIRDMRLSEALDPRKRKR